VDVSSAVLRFLETTGRRGEAAFYLRLFQAEAKERFATIAVNAQVAKVALDAVIVDLRFLAELGLTPVVVLGLVEAGEADEHASRIRRRLAGDQVRAQVLADDGEDLAGRAAELARAGIIPIIPFDANDGSSVDERFGRLAGLLRGLATRKLIFVNRSGALQGKTGPIDNVNLSTDYTRLVASGQLPRKQEALLQQCQRLITQAVQHELLISITSPIDLLRELFTQRGAGTLVRKGGVIAAHVGYQGIDLPRLATLITSAFGRSPEAGFFERPVGHVFLEDRYRGAALVVGTPLGGYLTKFVVDREAQGEGIGRDLWDRMCAVYPRLFWRARPDNPINTWYTQQADGFARFPEWHVFWKGLEPAGIAEAIAYALAQPIDLPSGAR
jgi:GNAT superfamily N-acetyltransferase